MNVIRPVTADDLDDLMDLTGAAGFGLTSLPADRDLMERRIRESEQSFLISSDKPRGELFVFVMEDLTTGRVVGTSCIISKVGGFEPFYAYKIRRVVHESPSLNIRKEIPTLELVQQHSGPCEIGGLFLLPEYRKHGNGRFLSLFRFLFMLEHRHRFEPTVIAEMRGVVDEHGRSPFWEALGRHFFDMDFPKADYLSLKDKRFIADLMPTVPIYITLLPPAAREVIGQVHEQTKPALKMLMDEGFSYSGMVDIFEAGPILSSRLDEIRVVRASKAAVIAEIIDEEIESPPSIVTNTHEQLRACRAGLMRADEGVTLSRSTAEALMVTAGERVRYSPLHPKRNEAGG